MYKMAASPAIDPSNDSTMIFILFLSQKLSLSGDLEVFPEAFILLNSGDSSSFVRIKTDRASKKTEKMKGTRQPQS